MHRDIDRQRFLNFQEWQNSCVEHFSRMSKSNGNENNSLHTQSKSNESRRTLWISRFSHVTFFYRETRLNRVLAASDTLQYRCVWLRLKWNIWCMQTHLRTATQCICQMRSNAFTWTNAVSCSQVWLHQDASKMKHLMHWNAHHARSWTRFSSLHPDAFRGWVKINNWNSSYQSTPIIRRFIELR